MRDEAFQRWLEQRYPTAVVATRLANVRRVERSLGELDAQFRSDRMEVIITRLTYSRADEIAGISNKSGIVIDGNIRTGLATLKAAIILYREFCNGQTAGNGEH